MRFLTNSQQSVREFPDIIYGIILNQLCAV